MGQASEFAVEWCWKRIMKDLKRIFFFGGRGGGSSRTSTEMVHQNHIKREKCIEKTEISKGTKVMYVYKCRQVI